MTREYREAALRRRFGTDEESKAKLDKFNEAQTDWYTTCRVCGASLRGSLEDMRKHAKSHGQPSPDPASDQQS